MALRACSSSKIAEFCLEGAGLWPLPSLLIHAGRIINLFYSHLVGGMILLCFLLKLGVYLYFFLFVVTSGSENRCHCPLTFAFLGFNNTPLAWLREALDFFLPYIWRFRRCLLGWFLLFLLLLGLLWALFLPVL